MPDKTTIQGGQAGKMATKAQRHKEKLLAKIYLCDLVSWWR
jgi:hypothetical protein